jgi:osmotically-inducible protein OsmY
VFGTVLLLAATLGAATQSDQQLLHRVAMAVNEYPHYTIFDDVDARVEDGIVTLTGKVTRPHKRQDLETRVSRVEGVRELRGAIVVLPASLLDDELRDRIARAIYSNSNFRNYAIMPNPPIHILVENGHVTLKGMVRNEVDRTLARALAGQFGAMSVTNELKTISESRQAGAIPD